MAVDRLLPTDEARELVALTRDIADKILDPIVDEHERAETYPVGVFAQLGAAGLLSLPQPEEWGGGGQPYEVYLQVLEELAARWAAVAVAWAGVDGRARRWGLAGAATAPASGPAISSGAGAASGRMRRPTTTTAATTTAASSSQRTLKSPSSEAR